MTFHQKEERIEIVPFVDPTGCRETVDFPGFPEMPYVMQGKSQNEILLPYLNKEQRKPHETPS